MYPVRHFDEREIHIKEISCWITDSFSIGVVQVALQPSAFVVSSNNPTVWPEFNLLNSQFF